MLEAVRLRVSLAFLELQASLVLDEEVRLVDSGPHDPILTLSKALPQVSPAATSPLVVVASPVLPRALTRAVLLPLDSILPRDDNHFKAQDSMGLLYV